MIINSVIVGAGGGPAVVPVDVKASLATQSATVNDKVTLIPSNTIYASEAFSTTFSTGNSYNRSDSFSTQQGGYIDFNGMLGVFTRVYSSSATNSNFFNMSSTLTFNSTVSAITSTSVGELYTYYVVPIGGDLAIQFYVASYSLNPFIYGVGSFKDGTYTPLWSSGSTSSKQFQGTALTRIGNCIVGNYGNGSSVGWLLYDPSTGIATTYAGNPVSNARFGYPTKKNDNYYIVVTSHNTFANTVLSIPGNGATSYTVANRGFYFNPGKLFALDENGDFYAYRDIMHGRSYLFKLDKTNDAWVEAAMDQPSEVFNSCFREAYDGYKSGAGQVAFQAKDFGSFVDIYIGSWKWGYDSTNKGNKIAHLKFIKATEKMERLADVFYDVDDLVGCDSLSVNWEQGLIAVVGPTDASHHKVYVRKLDSMAEVYPYVALSSARGNYTIDAITGFVAENKGPDSLGSTILSVNTTEDPTKEPFSNVGKIIGMNVIVSGGNV